MKLLLDTHILLGVIEEQTGKFPARIKRLIENPANEYYVSVATLWEIAIKFRLGKLRLNIELTELPEQIQNLGIGLIVINENHALTELHPEPPTRDPFDRLLLAQCQVEGLRLVTIDKALTAHPLAAC